MDPTLVLYGIRYGREHVKPRIDSWLRATAPDNPRHSRPLERVKQRAQDYRAMQMPFRSPRPAATLDSSCIHDLLLVLLGTVMVWLSAEWPAFEMLFEVAG